MIEEGAGFVSTPVRLVDQVVESGVNDALDAIYLADIDESTGTWFCEVVDHMNAKADTNSIVLNLNSPGGDVVSMFTIHDAIRLSRRPVRVEAFGQVCSAAVLILACAHERLVSESTCLMSHEPTTGNEALGIRAAKERRKYDDWNHSWWCDLMARYTPRDPTWWKRTTERKAELWKLGGAEIVEAGLADRLLGQTPARESK